MMYSYEKAAENFINDVQAGKYPPVVEGDSGKMAEIADGQIRYYQGTYVPQNPLRVTEFTCPVTVEAVVEAMRLKSLQFPERGR